MMEEWLLLKDGGICRCCALEGPSKDLVSKYSWMGDDEIYSDMLRECFNITLVTVEEGSNGGICEVCITQLRSAYKFRQHVLHTEEQFKKKLESKNLCDSAFVKLEIPPETSDTDMDPMGDNDDNSDYEVPLKKIKDELESEMELMKQKKTPAKTIASKSTRTLKKKASVEPETSKKITRTTKRETKSSKNLIVIKLKGSNKKGKQSNRLGDLGDISKSREIKKKIIIIQPQSGLKPVSLKKKNEVAKHLQNARLLMKYSNATPIRCKSGIGYRCAFCELECPEPSDLKTHTLTQHDTDENRNRFMAGRSISEYVVKLDITELSCRLCSRKCKSLDLIMEHLKNDHDKPIISNIKNHVIPFKFDDDVFRCALCSNNYNNFKVLLEHMNVHYNNYVCDVCGAGFVNSKTLQTHRYRHKTGVFHCSFCQKEFDNKIKNREHERSVHILKNKRSRCGYCGEKFNDYAKKNEHVVRVHGGKPTVINCRACDKTFDNQRALNSHTKSYHLTLGRQKHGNMKL